MLGWADRSTLLSAVEVGQPVTAAVVVATRGEGGGLVVLGDAAGGLHLLTPDGALIAQHLTGVAGKGAALSGEHATPAVVSLPREWVSG